VRHHYGFQCNEEGFVKEWLFSYPNGSKTVLFERDFSEGAKQAIYFGPSVKAVDRTLHDLADNRKSLFLSAAGQTSHEVFKPIHSYFSDHFVYVNRQETPFFDEATIDSLEDVEIREIVESVLRQADFGISSIEVIESPLPDESKILRSKLFKLFSEATSGEFPVDVNDTEKKIVFVHGHGENSFKLQASEESTGTIHLLKLLVPTVRALQEGKTLVIDEITTTLHTKLSEELVKLFTTPETNPNRAQFIFTTHDTNLLSHGVLRRDEIWFVEKSEDLKTSVFPLTDFKTRKSDNLEVGYLLGRYGAVPAFGDLTRAVSKANVRKNPVGS
jgi:hypothetical protein